MIKKIYTFGTSFTQGGGFEFDVMPPKFKKIYEIFDEEEQSQENFSYPGQLKKLLPNVEVFNLAKSGYGNERMYRKAIDLVLSDSFNSDDTLFLLEFSYLGRKEFYSKKLKDFIVVNYNNVENKSILNGYARTYRQSQYLSDKDISKLPSNDFFEKFVEKTFDENIQVDLMHFNNLKFLSFLNERNINYLFTQKPMMFPTRVNLDNYHIETHEIKTFRNSSFLSELDETSIDYETEGIYSDTHFGLSGSKYVASKIFDELIDRKKIKGNKLNQKLSDFSYIKKKIKLNSGNIL